MRGRTTSSSPTGFPPSKAPTRIVVLAQAASWRSAPIASCSKRGGVYAGLHALQFAAP